MSYDIKCLQTFISKYIEKIKVIFFLRRVAMFRFVCCGKFIDGFAAVTVDEYVYLDFLMALSDIIYEILKEESPLQR